MHDGEPPRARPEGPAAAERDAADLQGLARDWLTIWQSELAAAAADRELRETWQQLVAAWAGAAGAMLQGLPRGRSDAAPPGRAGPAAPPGPAPVAAAPDPRDAEIDRLGDRIAELERRLAELERDAERTRGDRGGAGRGAAGQHGRGRRPASGAG
jgi:hypothetical protein